MSRARALAAYLALVVGLGVLTGCSGGGERSAEPSGSPSSGGASAAGSASPEPTPTRATAPPRPRAGACHRLSFDQAVAPTTAGRSVPCARRHTSATYAVGGLDALVDGHLLAVDSRRVQQQVAQRCPGRLAGYVGGTRDDLRLSMLRAVWFTPTVEDSDAGADWYRCDVIALAADGRLAPLAGRMKGVLGTEAGNRFGMCGTDAPGAGDFRRVICSASHSWRAIDVVPVPGQRYPGTARARQAGQTPCEDAGRDAASDSLSFKWGYEWPTRKQWDAGQHYGRCWAPD